MTGTATTTAPFTRVEAPATVTGSALYAADHHPDGMLYAVLVGAPVSAGRARSSGTIRQVASPTAVT
jgi:xanthine dehydrogenase YagR molybdenum-binding subunit